MQPQFLHRSLDPIRVSDVWSDPILFLRLAHTPRQVSPDISSQYASHIFGMYKKPHPKSANFPGLTLQEKHPSSLTEAGPEFKLCTAMTHPIIYSAEGPKLFQKNMQQDGEKFLYREHSINQPASVVLTLPLSPV